MKFIGRDAVLRYDESHFVRQTPSAERKWQDSTWLHWFDLETKVGGVHRIGHEYNFDGEPKVALWSNLITPKGVYKKVVYLPLREADKLPDGWGGGDDTCRSVFEDGVHKWIIDDPDAGVSAEIAFRDFHESFKGFPGSSRTNDDIAPHHIDVGGAITGSITMQGQTFKATHGLGVRDHGWGHRDLTTFLSHRYFAGTFGPDLTFCAFAIHNGVNGQVESFGWVVKGGDTVVWATEIDMVVTTEIDSASTRGGRIVLTLADGDVIDCQLEAVAPGIMNHHHIPNLNTLCRATVAGREGVGMVETSMNYHLGERAPDRLMNGLVGNGFYPAGADGRVSKTAADTPFVVHRTLRT